MKLFETLTKRDDSKSKRYRFLFFFVLIISLILLLTLLLVLVGKKKRNEWDESFEHSVLRERLKPLKELIQNPAAPEVEMAVWNGKEYPSVCVRDNDPDLIAACDKISSFANDKREIIVSISNVGNIELWRNWALSALHAGVESFVTFVLEKETFDVEPKLKEHLVSLPHHLHFNPNSNQFWGEDRLMDVLGLSSSPEKNDSDFFKFRSKNYVLLMKSVPDIILWVLKQNYSIVYSDTDIFFFSDPFVEIAKLDPKVNWFGSVDTSVKSPSDCVKQTLCGGLIFARYSNFSLQFTEEWSHAVQISSLSTSGNQKAYNKVVHAIGTKKFGLLPCDLFPNGHRFNEVHMGEIWRPAQNRSPVMVHNNWIVGREPKIRAFQRWGMWMDDLDPNHKGPIIPTMDVEKAMLEKKHSPRAKRRSGTNSTKNWKFESKERKGKGEKEKEESRRRRRREGRTKVAALNRLRRERKKEN